MKTFTMLSLLALAGVASAQTLYAPQRTVKDQGISIKGWGSGTIAETDEVGKDGPRSLRVSTRNYFQGGILTYASPIDLSKAAGDKNNLLQFSVRVAESGSTSGAGSSGGPGRPGGFAGAGGPGGPGGVGGQGGGPGGKQGGGPGGAGGGGGATGGSVVASAQLTDVPLRTVRMIVTTSDGKKSEAFLPINGTFAKTNWVGMAIPLSAINGFDRTNKMVTGLAFSGDATSTFYIGDLKVANDSTPIQGEMNIKDPMNLALGDELEFQGYGFAGATPVVFSWDFDASDGIQVDAEGQVVKRKFRKAGTYTVTLTVSDMNHVKTPVMKTVKITVNP